MAKQKRQILEYDILALQQDRNAKAILTSQDTRLVYSSGISKPSVAKEYALSDQNKPVPFSDVDNISKSEVEAEAKSSYLKGNPFFHHLKQSPIAVETIEEYYCVYKKNYISIEELTRYAEYKPRIKRKILKKNFAIWKKDYLKEKKHVFKGIDQTFTMLQELEIKESKWLKRLGYIFLFVFLGMIQFNQLGVQEWLFGDENAIRIQQAYQDISVSLGFIPTVISIVFYSLFAWILIAHATDAIQKKYRVDQVYGKSLIEGSKSTLDKEFSKRYKKVFNYYLKRVVLNAKRNPPLKMDKVCPPSSLENLEIVKNKLVDDGAKLKKNLWLIKTSRFVFFHLAIFGAIAVLLFQIFIIVKGMFF